MAGPVPLKSLKANTDGAVCAKIITVHAKSHLAKIQRVMYQRLQIYARSHSPTPGAELKRYHEEYQNELRHFERTSGKPELIRAVVQTPIVIVGDYHTLPQAQRTLLRIVRDSLPEIRKKKIVLAIEWLRPEDNFAIARYLRNQISEARFLRDVRFFSRWGFDWKNYRGLFELAKASGLQIVGLAKSGERSLAARDRFAAERIASIIGVHPQAHVFVLIGDLHLAVSHLPSEIERRLRQSRLKRNILTIHQNIERFYWNLMDRGLDHRVDVVKVSKRAFCVLNTPPWLKLQSHLKWLEMTDSAPKPHRLEAEIFQGVDLSIVDLSDDVRDILRHLQAFLEMPPEPLGVDFIVCGADDNSWLRNRRPSDRKRLLQFLRRFESFFDPVESRIVLSTLSHNQLAAQSARLLHSQLSGYTKSFKSPQRDFYSAVWGEALGYLGAKIINPKRKCNGLEDLKRIQRRLDPSVRIPHREFNVTADVAEIAVIHLEQEPDLTMSFPFRVSNARLVFYYKVAKILGHLLGHGIYEGTLHRKIKKTEVRQLFRNSLTDARKLYVHWIRRLDKHHLRRQSKHDTL